jgi:hypothetical protein
MKTYPLYLDDIFHAAIKHSSEEAGESIKEFITLAIKARLTASDYVNSDKELIDNLKNRKNIKFMEIGSAKELLQ